MTSLKRLGTVTFLVAIMLLSPIAGVMGGAVAVVDDDETITIDEDNNVEAWQWAPISFQADTGGATDTVELPGATINTQQGDASHDPEFGVYDTGEITFNFGDSSDVDPDDVDLEDASVLRGQLHDDADVNVSEMPTSINGLADLFTGENRSAVNDNVTFTLDAEPEFDDDTYTNETEETGTYFYVLADGLEEGDVQDGNLERVSDTTILGGDLVLVHEGSSDIDVTTDDWTPGDDVDVDVNATALTGDVNHALMLYDGEEFAGEHVTVNVTEDLTENLSIEDITIDHEIEEIDGVQNVDDGVELFGQSISEAEGTGVAIADLVSFFGNETGLEHPNVEGPDGEGNTIIASTNATVADADTDITLETNESWDEGDYDLLHVAMGDASDEFQIGTETVTLEEDEDETPPPGIGPGPPTDPEPDKPEAVISIDPDPATVDEEITFSAAKSTADRMITDYTWTIDGETYEGETVTASFSEPGTYDVELVVSTAVADSEPVTETVTVEEEVDDDDDDPEPPEVDDDDDDDDDSIPGFGMTVALVALLSAALLALRRQN